MPRELLKGNEAMAEAAIRVGLEAYFGYPITPQTEILEWMSRRMPELGPGLGNIAPSQGDYNQMVHGGGHGDYHPIVLAPATVQEAVDLTVEAFDLAEKYRNLVFVVADGNVGQIMEPAELPAMREGIRATPDWALTGAEGRARRFLSSVYIDPVYEEVTNKRPQESRL